MVHFHQSKLTWRRFFDFCGRQNTHDHQLAVGKTLSEEGFKFDLITFAS